MKQYVIQYCQSQPNWNNIPTLEIDHRYRQTPLDYRAYGQLIYNDEALLVHLWADVPEILATEVGPYGMPCHDSCLEFFFCPMSGDSRYINIEFNYNGCMYLGIGTKVEDLMRLIPERENDIFESSICTTSTGWEIFYNIPYAFIRRFFPDFNVVAGHSIRANCYTCADRAQPPYYLSWNPIQGERFSFHKSQCFGLMTFSDQ